MGKTIKLNNAAIACLPAILAIHHPDPNKFLIKAIALSLEIKNRCQVVSPDIKKVEAIIDEGRLRLLQIKKEAYEDLLQCEAEHRAAFDKLREAQPELKTVEFSIDHFTNEVTIESTRQDLVDIEDEEDMPSIQQFADAEDLLQRIMRH